MENRPRLDSWKEIGAYLGRDVRTVIRWELRRGLPVHRVPGGKIPRVFAYADELDDWLKSRGSEADGPARAPGDVSLTQSDIQPVPPPQQGARRWTIAAALVAACAAGGAGVWALTAPREPLERVIAVGHELRAIDAQGNTRWTYRDPSAERNIVRSRFADLDGDARDDVIASLEVDGAGPLRRAGELAAFSEQGDLRWSYKVDDRLRFREEAYAPPWAAHDVSIYPTRAGTRIAWAVHHFTWWPSMLLTFDASGRRLSTFVNSGWIRGATPSPDGAHLLVTGVSNSRQAPFVAVLNADDPSGHSPEPPGHPMECLDCPAGNPEQYYILSRTDVGQVHPFVPEGPTVMALDAGALQIHSLESQGPNIATVIYDLDGDLRVRGARFADSFWEWHRQLELDGGLMHTAEDCPHRTGLAVQRWTPAAGWETISVPTR